MPVQESQLEPDRPAGGTVVSAGRGFQFIEIGSNRNASSGGPAL